MCVVSYDVILTIKLLYLKDFKIKVSRIKFIWYLLSFIKTSLCVSKCNKLWRLLEISEVLRIGCFDDYCV
jgi:hypothetical protein